MKKLFKFIVFSFLGFLALNWILIFLSSRETNISDSPIITGCDDGEILDDGVCVDLIDYHTTYVDYLREVGLDVDLIDYDRVAEVDAPIIDYSDDSRQLWDVSSYSEADVIVFPDQAFNDLIRLELGLEEGEDITFGQLQTITRLDTMDEKIKDIKSIEGIELLTNLNYFNVAGNIELASINGIQALENIEELYIGHTSVKKIDYENDSLEKIVFVRNFLECSTVTELSQKLEGYPNLKDVTFRDGGIRIDSVDALVSLASEIVNFYMNDIDFGKVDVFDLINHEGDPLYENLEPQNSIFINLENDNFSQEVSQGLDEHYSNIGITEEMNDVEKIFLIHNYFYDTFKNQVSQDGETRFDKILNSGYNIDLGYVNYLYKLFLEKAEIKIFRDAQSVTYVDLENTEDIARETSNFIGVELEGGRRFALDIKHNLRSYLETGNESLRNDRLFFGVEDLLESLNNQIPEEFKTDEKYTYFNTAERRGEKYINEGSISVDEIQEALSGLVEIEVPVIENQEGE